MTFSESQLHTLEGALRVAALQYERDAVTARDALAALLGANAKPGNRCRIADQFERQAEECRELVAALEQRGETGADGDCTNAGGHQWNRSAGEADEARIAGDYANDNIRCIHCGADGDA